MQLKPRKHLNTVLGALSKTLVGLREVSEQADAEAKQVGQQIVSLKAKEGALVDEADKASRIAERLEELLS